MEITNGEVNVDLPDSLAKLLLSKKSWAEGTTEVEDDRVEGRAEEDAPIPMTHIPGVVPGVSMSKVKRLVDSGRVPVTVKKRTKLVRPSDVVAALNKTT